MKKNFIFQGTLDIEISQESFEHICSIFPSLSETSYFARLAEGSQELFDFKELVSRLDIDLIYYPDSRERRLPECLKVTGEIELGREDFSSEYFSVYTGINLFKSYDEISIDPNNFTKDQVNPLQDIGVIVGGRISNTVVFANSLKVEFDAQNFKGLSLKPLPSRDDSSVIFWLVGSSVILPPAKNNFKEGDTRWGATKYFSEFFTPSLLRYSATDFSSVQSFDVALTQEVLGNSAKRQLVVSSRFRQWALDRGLQLEFEPVIIED